MMSCSSYRNPTVMIAQANRYIEGLQTDAVGK